MIVDSRMADVEMLYFNEEQHHKLKMMAIKTPQILDKINRIFDNNLYSHRPDTTHGLNISVDTHEMQCALCSFHLPHGYTYQITNYKIANHVNTFVFDELNLHSLEMHGNFYNPGVVTNSISFKLIALDIAIILGLIKGDPIILNAFLGQSHPLSHRQLGQ